MFLTHTSCPVCPSSDAYAIYTGGSGYCFSCGFYRHGTSSPYLVDAQALELVDDKPVLKPLPDDAGFEYSNTVVDWVLQYEIPINTLLEYSVLYSKRHNQLIFPFYRENSSNFLVSSGGEDAFDDPVLWQARNFTRNSSTPKYYTHGPKEEYIPIFRPTNVPHKQTVVIVEDCISAMKMTALGAIGLPCLGSSMGTAKLARLRAAMGPKTHYVVWLDGNMYDKAQEISQRLRLMGNVSGVIYTENDPKECPQAQIKELLDTTGIF